METKKIKISYDDFDKNLKSKFNMTSLDFNKDSDRKKFINSLPDKKRFTRIAHYWAISPDGEIHDPTGMYQFYDTGLSEDLNRDRYEPIDIWDWDTGKKLNMKFNTIEPWEIS